MTLEQHIKQRIIDLKSENDATSNKKVPYDWPYGDGWYTGLVYGRLNEIDFLKFLLKEIKDGQVV